MKLLKFPEQLYELNPAGNFNYIRKEDSFASALEILWSAITMARAELGKKDIKVIRRIKNKVKEITIFKDKDNDSRVPLPGDHELILEHEEYDMIQKLMEHNNFSPKFAEDVDDLWNIIDNPLDYSPPKPSLIK